MENNQEAKVIRCPQCGSSDITLITKETGKCNNCNGMVKFPKDKQVVNVNNQFNVQTSANKDVNFFAIKKEIDDVEFLRKTLVNLSADARTPADILTANFKPVIPHNEQYIVVKGDADVNYSATIGYDRKEEYKEWNSTRKQYETKTKTVTDWQSFSGKHSGTYSASASNGDNLINSAFEFDVALYYTKPQNIVPIDQVNFEIEAPNNPSSTAISNAKNKILSSCQNEAKTKLPGDRNKDFSASGTVSVTEINSYSAPAYSITYKYKQKEIQNGSFAFGNFKRIGDTIDSSQTLMNVVNNKTKPFDFTMLGVSIITALIMLLTMICSWSKITLLSSLVMIGFKIFTSINYKKLLNEIVAINQTTKKEKLSTMLKVKKLSPLTVEEIKSFQAKGKSLSPTKHKLRTAGTVFFVIALILTLACLFSL